MKRYEVTSNIWRNGLMVEAGSQIELRDAEAKYLRHALREPKAEVPVETTVAAAEPVAVELPAEEPVVEKPRRRRHKGEAVDGDHH